MTKIEYNHFTVLELFSSLFYLSLGPYY